MPVVAVVPEKNTFVHFDDASAADLQGPPTSSAPPVLLERFFKTRSEVASASLEEQDQAICFTSVKCSPGTSAATARGHSPLGSGPSNADVGRFGVPSCALDGDSAAVPPSCLPPRIPPALSCITEVAVELPPPPQSPIAAAFVPRVELPLAGLPLQPLSSAGALAVAMEETVLAPPPQSPTAATLPSAGSALHAAGGCCPCAWFWKPQGCDNGASCARCHLCPQGEVKARKKAAKQALVRREKERQKFEEPAYVSVAQLETAHMPTPAMTTSAAAGGEPATLSGIGDVPLKNTFIHYSEPASDVSGGPPVYSAPCILLRPDVPTSDSASPLLPLRNDGTSAASTGEPETTTAETGTAAHARGECRPCSYFWYKVDGCRNGHECAFCHLCEKGENKKRKRDRIRALKASGQFKEAHHS